MSSKRSDLDEGRVSIMSIRVAAETSSVSVARGKRRQPQPRAAVLSARECRVLLEISRGATNKEVARLLEISPSTVRTHVESIFRKLGCSTRAAATLKGSTLGLIS
jgi:DNA-binding NarL/FixJ family response regulator